jgi:hypothetical protein
MTCSAQPQFLNVSGTGNMANGNAERSVRSSAVVGIVTVNLLLRFITRYFS